MKEQIVILKIKFDENYGKPQNWNWSELLGCDDCIEILNYGIIEEVIENE